MVNILTTCERKIFELIDESDIFLEDTSFFVIKGLTLEYLQ